MASHRVFLLNPYGRTPFRAVVLTPEPVDQEIVQAAWSYAVRYTAKGIDLPDYEAAMAMVKERHPSWTIAGEESAPTLTVDLNKADNDKPET